VTGSPPSARPFRASDYSWIVLFLRSRSLQRPAQLGAASGCIAFGVWAVFMMASSLGPVSPVAVFVLAAAASSTFVAAGCWIARPWPSERVSIVFVAGADLIIAASLFTFTEPAAASPGTGWFAFIGVYVAFFHGARSLIVHLCWAAAVTVVLFALSLWTTDIDLWFYISRLVVQLSVIGAAPIFTQIAEGALRRGAHNSHHDPLTGLLNRRGFRAAVGDRMRPACPTAARVGIQAVLMIDLDRFKSVNDTHGHDHGDRVLRRIARIVTEACSDSELVARMGGEEFVVATSLPVATATDLAERIRQSIDRSGTVTASVGLASAAPSRTVPGASDIDDLITRADQAMYRAKKSGGNRTVCDGP
jgi:diguanylate cyclase (GGDEF)-like protein